MKHPLFKQYPKFSQIPLFGLKEAMLKRGLRHRTRGFTLVEMIGVLAIIAILMALLFPKAFQLVASSKVQSLAAAIRTYETALTRYFTDVGSLYPLDVTGIPTTETTGNSTVSTSLPARLTLNASDPLNTGANQWRRFRGPYLERFDSANPPGIGTSMFMPATTPVSYGTSVTTTNFGWDLDAKDGLSDIPTGHTVIYLRITGIRQRDFLHLNNILDGGSSLARSYSPQLDTAQPPILASLVAGGGGGPPPPANTLTRGRLKYNVATQTALIYLAHSP